MSAKLYGSSRELEGGDVTVRSFQKTFICRICCCCDLSVGLEQDEEIISQVPGGLSDLIDGLAHRLKEGTVSETQQLLSDSYFFLLLEGTT